MAETYHLFAVCDVAEELGVSPKTVWGWTDARLLLRFEYDGQTLVSIDEIIARGLHLPSAPHS